MNDLIQTIWAWLGSEWTPSISLLAVVVFGYCIQCVSFLHQKKLLDRALIEILYLERSLANATNKLNASVSLLNKRQLPNGM